VRRVVLTSSFAAMSYGHARHDAVFTEEDWTDLDGDAPVSAYAKSKTLAERAAWDFVGRDGGDMELSVVNPVGILGPVLGRDVSTSLTLIQRLLNRDMPALPRLSFGLVDVRDVAALHLRALEDPAAAGERFLAVSGEPLWIADMARVLRSDMGVAGRRVPTREAPDWLIRVAARFDPSLRAVIGELGKVKRASAAKAQSLLGWEPRPVVESIVDSAESLIRLGVVRAPG
jgi:dihydroflavonol-4-reductase